MRGELSRTVLRGLAGSDARPATRLALATTQEGDVPLFLRPLDGNSSDKVTLASAVEVKHEQLRTSESDPSFFVADSGIYSEARHAPLQRSGDPLDQSRS